MTVAFPPGSAATHGSVAFPMSSDSTGMAPPHPPPTTKRFAQRLDRTPSDWVHTAVAFPAGSIATRGRIGSPLAVSSSTEAPQPIPGTYRFAHALNRARSDCFQTTTASPLGATARKGNHAFPTFPSTRTGLDQPSVAVYRADQMLSSVPLDWDQTTVALPPSSTPTRGSKPAVADCPLPSIAVGVPQPAPDTYRAVITC